MAAMKNGVKKRSIHGRRDGEVVIQIIEHRIPLQWQGNTPLSIPQTAEFLSAVASDDEIILGFAIDHMHAISDPVMIHALGPNDEPRGDYLATVMDSACGRLYIFVEGLASLDAI